MYTITIVSWHMKTLILVAFLFERRRRTLAAVFCAFVSKLSSFSFSNEEEESNQISSHTKRRSKVVYVVYYSLCSSSTQQNTKNDAADDDDGFGRRRVDHAAKASRALVQAGSSSAESGVR